MAHLSLSLLGSFQATLAGEPVTTFESNKVRALLAYLAVEADRPHPRESLVGLLWPELPEQAARNNLRHTLATLRRTIADREADPSFLITTRETIQFNCDGDCWLDVSTFVELIETDEADPTSIPHLSEAVDLYRGTFLAGFSLKDSAPFDDWLLLTRERLQRWALAGLHRLAEYYQQQGDYDSACRYAWRQVELEPWQEEAHQQLMLLLALNGQRSKALAQYESCCRYLTEELEVEPGPETTALYEQIQAGTLKPPAIISIPMPDSQPALPSFLDEVETQADDRRPIFVAREDELARLDALCDQALAGHGQVVFVTGGPGRGKTVLVQTFVRQAQEAHADLIVAMGNGNAYTGLGDPYLLFREILGLLTGDVEDRWAAGAMSREQARRLWQMLPTSVQSLVDVGPDLIDTFVPGTGLLNRATVYTQGSGQTEWLTALAQLVERQAARSGPTGVQQSALFEQYTRLLQTVARQYPLLLVLDDLQWADAGSISLLFHLGRRLTGDRILVVGAYRPGDVALGRDGGRHPLEPVINEFKRDFGDIELDLGQTQDRHFVDAFLDTEANQLSAEFRETLFRQTEGHALFTVELLRGMQERGDLVQNETGCWVEGPALDWETLPARVEAVIAERIGRLPQEWQAMLAVASVEGEEFTAEVVARVQGLDEQEVIRQLSGALSRQHHLVQAQSLQRLDGQRLSHYRFRHYLFQNYLYHRLDDVERMHRHEAVGNTLETLYGDRAEKIAVQLAHHYTRAGQTEKAIIYFLCAGEAARAVSATEEAIAYFNRVLVLLREFLPDEAGVTRWKDWRLEALKRLGQIYHGVGKLTEAEEYFQEAIAFSQEMGLTPREIVRFYYLLGETFWWQGRYDDHIRIGEAGLALLGTDTESAEAALMLHAIGAGSAGKGDLRRFWETKYQIAQSIQRFPDSQELKLHCDILGLISLKEKKVEEALKQFKIYQKVADSCHDLHGVEDAFCRMGDLLGATGDLRGCIAQYNQALDLVIRTGNVKQEFRIAGGMAGWYLLMGDLQKVEEYAERIFEASKAMGTKAFSIDGYCYTGMIALCENKWEKAVNVFQRAIQLYQEISYYLDKGWIFYSLGRAYLAQGDQVQALKQFQASLTLVGEKVFQVLSPYMSPQFQIHFILSGLEAAYENSTAFRAFCHQFQQDRPEIDSSSFKQWYLEPAKVTMIDEPPLCCDEFTASLSPDWEWQDQFGDCSFTIQNGLEIHAANGRDLWHINLSAPRMLRLMKGDFAMQTVCASVTKEKPSIGGLVLWKNRENFLCLEWGGAGKYEIFFGGCLGNEDVIIGRGQLEVDESLAQVFLRLERIANQVDAFCSVDGENWFTVGHIDFP